MKIKNAARTAIVLFSVTLVVVIGFNRLLISYPELYRFTSGSAISTNPTRPIDLGLIVGVEDIALITHSEKRRLHFNLVRPFPGKSNWLVVNDIRGKMYLLTGSSEPALLFFDAALLIGENFKAGNLEIGLASFAFHPDFARPGKAGENLIYTVHSEKPSNKYYSLNIPYFGLEAQKAHHLSLISEWEVDTRGLPKIKPKSQRIMLVLEQPQYDHNLYYIDFNPTVAESDSDYGLLYVGVGNGGRRSQLELDNRTLFGKILRINPLQNNSQSYDIPADNPFVSSGRMRPEVWAYGFRNPQHFSWDFANGDMYAIDIGHDNIEEVNLIRTGKNYGWSYFEGSYLFNKANSAELKKSYLPTRLMPLEFPVAEYDHSIGRAIAGGYVYRGFDIPELHGHYIFGDIISGKLFHFDTKELASAGPANVYEIQLVRGASKVSMAELVGEKRVDLRLSLNSKGEILVINKRDGVIRQLLAIGNRQ